MMESDDNWRNFWHFCTHKGLNQPKMARKQGNICQNMQKQGSFGVFLFRVQLNFSPVFKQDEMTFWTDTFHFVPKYFHDNGYFFKSCLTFEQISGLAQKNGVAYKKNVYTYLEPTNIIRVLFFLRSAGREL